jgi:hypothetical protein
MFILGSSWAKTTLELSTLVPEVKQGSIIDCELSIKESEGKSTLSGLAGRDFAKTIYVISLDPFVQKNGILVSNARVVFEKVPASDLIEESELSIILKKIKVLPAKPAQSFLFGDFEVAGQVSFLKWIVTFILVVVIGGIFLKWRNKYLRKKKSKLRKLSLKEQLLKPSNYDEIVAAWENKHIFLDEFPDLAPAFIKLEAILFKYQFKSQRNEFEITQILIAYDQFRNDVREVLNGI